MYDLLKVSDGLIGHSDGFVNVNGRRVAESTWEFSWSTDGALAEFRLIVFRPFKGEIITGRISSCTEQGIRGMFICFSGPLDSNLAANGKPHPVSVDFFSDIHVPASLLFEGSAL